MKAVGALLVLALSHTLTCSPISTSPKLYIFDVDGGADDIFELSLALLNPSMANILAITTVFGNTDLEHCTNNVLRTLQLLDRGDVPVFKGSANGTVFSYGSDDYFGTDGLGDVQWNETVRLAPEPTHAARYLADIVDIFPGRIVLVATGPLTNIALAQHLNPSFLQKLHSVYVMGGAYLGVGNIHPGVEFNFYQDPLAVEFILLEALNAAPLTLLPLETTPRIPIDWRLNTFGKIDSDYVRFLNLAERKILSGSGWSPNDQLTGSVAMNNSFIVETLNAHAIALTEGGDAKGALLIDYSSKDYNVKIVTKVDEDAFKKFVLSTFSAGTRAFELKYQLMMLTVLWTSQLIFLSNMV